jgi:23S rRNA (adenine2503-C2)-methyltransferase
MNIYNLTFAALEAYFTERGENKAKAKIVYNALYKDMISGFNEIGSLSGRITAMLSTDFTFGGAEILEQTSCSDAVKFLLGLSDGAAVEAVVMRHGYGSALCISTQVGCNMGCAFCQSGALKKTRDLLPHEMVQQILKCRQALGEKINRVTLMGIGEPLDNFAHVADFLGIIGHKHGLAIAPRHITVSTCGLIPEMERLLSEGVGCNFAISLHAPNDEIRSRLMPVNRTYGVEKTIQAVRKISAAKNKKVTLEYVLLDGVNDSDGCACELAKLIKGINCYVNLIPYNETQLGFSRSKPERIKSFYSILIQSGVRAVVRREFGAELKAACGQLKAIKGETK